MAVARVGLGLQQRGDELLVGPLLRVGAVGELRQRRAAAFDTVPVARAARIAARPTATRGGAFASPASCDRPGAFLAANGARAWAVTLPRRLAPGACELIAHVTDSAGQQRSGSRRVVVR